MGHMNSATTYEIASTSLKATLTIAGTLARRLQGGEVIELIGDLGSGKTAFVRGLAKGINSRDKVQSPSFTVERIYHGQVNGRPLIIHHFDFHRLDEPGIMGQQLSESTKQLNVVTVIEWAQAVQNVLPKDRLQIWFATAGKESRQLKFKAVGDTYQRLIKPLTTAK